MRVIDDQRRLNIISNLLSEYTPYCDIEELQRGNDLIVDGVFGIDSFNALYNKILNVVDIEFEGDYYKEKHSKNQIVLHHTAGWDNARGVYDWWKADKVRHVATSVGVNDSGQLYRGFNEDYWAHHIGCNDSHFCNFELPNINKKLNQSSVALEICSWGRLEKADGVFHNYLGKSVQTDVSEVSYRCHSYYESYTEQEIETTKKWVLLMSIKYDIPLEYNEQNLWEVNTNALTGQAGIYTHGSYRPDKDDIFPMPEMVEMLKNLKNYEKLECQPKRV